MRDPVGVGTFRVIERACASGASVAPPSPLLVKPDVVVCGWCGHFGRPHVHARAMKSRRWRAMPHAEALAHARAGSASHGLCPACLPLAVNEWDAEAADKPVTPIAMQPSARPLSDALR